MSDPTIPATMKPWHGGDSAPADWDKSDVLWQHRGGKTEMSWVSEGGSQWTHETWPKIIAYTPALSTPTTPDEGEEALERLFAQAFNDGIAAGKSGDEELLAGSASAYAQAAMLAFRPSKGEGLREALTPSGDTKAAYMGEFSFNVPDYDDEGEECQRKVYVPWDAIKEIMAAILKRGER